MSAMLEECLSARPHVVDGKEVECKRAMPREGMQQPLPELHVTSKKVSLDVLACLINTVPQKAIFLYYLARLSCHVVEVIVLYSGFADKQ